jgi:hypothetical protein
LIWSYFIPDKACSVLVYLNMRCSRLPLSGTCQIWLCKNTGKHKETRTLIKQNISVVISRVHKGQIKMAKPSSIEKFLLIFKMKILQGNGKLRTQSLRYLFEEYERAAPETSVVIAYIIYSRNMTGQLLKHLWL